MRRHTLLLRHMQTFTKPIYLASTSPRRRELIQLFGLAFRFISADVDEAPMARETPTDLVQRLSRAKAAIGLQNAKEPDAIVIGADTVVAFESSILGKPTDADDAVRMLKQLRRKPHVVYSGITVMRDDHALTQVATTTVWMRDYSDAEIAAYVASGDPLDKAAAYAIQHNGFRPVERIDGCFANVMGLPLCHLYRALKAFGISVAEPDHACQDYLQINCPVAQEILSVQYSATTGLNTGY
jgi:septum formation protein